ncbi:MAG: hypothetical protein LAP87_06600 [Acidobacteriia bacterium]|nr:hypothetical protein [Terriglobia bacterium]
MPNVNVFRGSDAVLVLAVDDKSTAEGSLADALIGEYEFSTVVGRLQNVEVSVKNDVKPFYEIGKRFATELRPGNIDISGSAERAHVNGALLRLLLGDGAKSPAPTGAMPQPVFNMVISLKNPALPNNSDKVTLFGVKFDGWSFHLPEDAFVMESVTFKALRVSSEEASG